MYVIRMMSVMAYVVKLSYMEQNNLVGEIVNIVLLVISVIGT